MRHLPLPVRIPPMRRPAANCMPLLQPGGRSNRPPPTFYPFLLRRPGQSVFAFNAICDKIHYPALFPARTSGKVQPHALLIDSVVFQASIGSFPTVQLPAAFLELFTASAPTHVVHLSFALHRLLSPALMLPPSVQVRLSKFQPAGSADSVMVYVPTG